MMRARCALFTSGATRAALFSAVVLALQVHARAGTFSVTNLVTDDKTAHDAILEDKALKNAWGVSHSAGSPFWVSDNGTGIATLYNVNPSTNLPIKQGLEVTIPGDGHVTGQVFSGVAGQFNSDLFLFVSEDGTISGWRGALGTTAEVLQSPDPANTYKGAAIDAIGGHSYLYSANFHAGTIDILKGDAGAPDLASKFVDPGLPAGYAPFNIQLLGNTMYVTYALQAANKTDDDPGAGHGFVSAFDVQGNFEGRIASQGTLDSPWGLAIAPSSFGSIAGDLLVGNFGDGRINVFSPDPAHPAFLGQLDGPDGNPIAIDGLWALIAGNDGAGGSSSKIYFSAGPDGESHGLFGVITAVPEPGSVVLALIGIGVIAVRGRWGRK